ncbi:YlxR family protein [bacterium]|nr:YlxR family protein [bacterium]
MSEILRKCQGCGKIANREEFIKITKCHTSGEIIVNPKSKVMGRSLYVCKNKACIDIIFKKKKFEREFRINADKITLLKEALYSFL